MPPSSPPNEAHPGGEPEAADRQPGADDGTEPWIVDTPGGRFRAQFTPDLPVSSLGALVFFAQFLATTGAFDALVADTPLCYGSNRAHSPRDVLGTLLLGILSGHYRYAHLAALRGDDIAPRLLGLNVIVSEDCVRRALKRIGPNEGRDWLRRHLDQACHPFLDTKWVLDIDVTIKPIYGRQEGASLGHNPHKPGRPAHAYHTYWIATLRLCLDVEVHPGKESAAGHGFDGLWALIDRLPPHRRPHLLRGDCAYGQEALLCEAERRGLNYLCKLRRTAKARRVLVLRRRLNDLRHPRARRRLVREQARHGLLLSEADAAACEPIIYEHQILVTNLPYEILTLATLYRERGDAENPFDELKNQWSWAGFTTHDLRSCQHAARLAALAYNGWTLYHRLLRPGQHHEAVTTRPRLLCGAARQTEHAGQRRLDVRLSHAEAPTLQDVIRRVSMWLQQLLRNAPQWNPARRWGQIVARILRENFAVAGPAPPSAIPQA